MDPSGPVGWSRALVRWGYVLRYYRPGQLAGRAARRLRRWAERRLGRRRRLGTALARGGVPALRGDTALAAWAQRQVAGADPAQAAAEAERVMAGRFRFLNQEWRLPQPLDWQLREIDPPPTRLWRFALHYQEYLLDLAAYGRATASAEPAQRAWDLVASWIDGNRPDDPAAADDAWHPYVISRRVPVWIALWHAAPPEAALAGRVLESLAMQSRFLAKNLEFDLGGNHLLENLRALALAGAFFAGPEADGWLRRAGRLLRRELSRQVLPHGEHFERSPSYHQRMLALVEDVRDALAGIAPELSARCARTAARMVEFLQAVLHPDGQVPLLGDSWLGQQGAGSGEQGAGGREKGAGSAEHGARSGEQRAGAQSFETPILRARKAPHAGRVGPYWVFRDGGDFLLFDAGPVGPDHLPAHAHADLLGLEISWGGRRVVVDSGVFDYEDGPMRRYCRSTAAHNCLQIDGQDQCDMWSRFRMGYRGWPGPLQTGQTGDFHWAWAWHNAYRRLRVPRVGRLVACRPGGPWFCLDWAEGRGTHRLVSRLHLHPDVRARQVDPTAVELDSAGGLLHLEFLGPGTLTIQTGWYCPQLGLRLPSAVVCWQAEAPLPAAVAWCLAEQGARSAGLGAGRAGGASHRCSDAGASHDDAPTGASRPRLVSAGALLRELLDALMGRASTAHSAEATFFRNPAFSAALRQLLEEPD